MKKILVTAAVVGIGLCSILKVEAQENLRLLLDWVPDAGHSPLFLAKEQGWFEKAGINLAIEFGKGSALSAQTVGSGAVPVAFSAVRCQIDGLVSDLVHEIFSACAHRSIHGFARRTDPLCIDPIDRRPP